MGKILKGGIMEDDNTKIRVIPVETYSRVVGYYQVVANWNAGKLEEFKERETISLEKFKEREESGNV